MNLELKAKPPKEANMDNPLQAKRSSGRLRGKPAMTQGFSPLSYGEGSGVR